MKGYFFKKRVDVALYTGVLAIVLTNDINKVKRIYGETFYRDEEVYLHALMNDEGGRCGYTIMINFHRGVDITHGSIAHEAYHIAVFIADQHGIDMCYHNSEPMAYLVDWVTREVYKFIRAKGYYNKIK